MRLGTIPLIILFITAILIVPALATDLEFETWELPDDGAGSLVVNPADGSLWIFMHQTRTLVALDSTDGAVIMEVPLNLRPTAMAFTPDGSAVVIVGEPLGDQHIDQGAIAVIDTNDGSLLTELEINGAGNAVYITPDGVVYITCGMQYSYQGTIYKLRMDSENSRFSLAIEYEAVCGKIPWAIAESDGILYVTDLELQWAMQADGSMGPPYGAYVWAYYADTLEFIDRSLVGISPSRLGVTDAGVLVACSGRRQADYDPTLSLLVGPDENIPIYVESTGASDLAVAPDGSWAVASLADWGPPGAGTDVATLQFLNPGSFADARRWIYTGDIALISIEEEQIVTRRVCILQDSYIRSLIISLDGTVIYALEGDGENVLVIPVEALEQ